MTSKKYDLFKIVSIVLLILFVICIIIVWCIKNNFLYKAKIFDLPIVAEHRNKCVPVDKNIKPCKSSFDFLSDNKSSQLIERYTLKAVLDTETKYKLMNLTDIFTPSSMYGTYCNQIYTTYYDFLKGSYKPHLFAFLKEKKVKRVRIRHYYYDPNSYFEIKYKGNKIRVLIDCQYNILEPVDPLYEDIVTDMISKIKMGDIPELFINKYKRFSFVYKSNQAIRITIDTNIKINYLDTTQTLPFDILEIKYNKNIPKTTILNYFKEIEDDTEEKIKLSSFSKVDYSIDNIIIPYNIKKLISGVQW
jgi:hypothetical protein